MTEVQEVSADAGGKKSLTKEERSVIAKDAAKRRWAKTKREQAKAAKSKSLSKGGKTGKANSPREFVSALRTAEKRLVKAIQERAKAGADYAILSAEIPALTHLINALRNPTGTAYTSTAYANTAIAGISLEAIVGDQPLPYQNPPRAMPAGAPAPPAAVPVPQSLHPANQQSRAQGGAVGVALEESEDENQFLHDSAVAGGQWR